MRTMMRYYLDSAKLLILPYILGFDVLTMMEERVKRSWRLGMKEGLAGRRQKVFVLICPYLHSVELALWLV
jgi:hypothetical protein